MNKMTRKIQNTLENGINSGSASLISNATFSTPYGVDLFYKIENSVMHVRINNNDNSTTWEWMQGELKSTIVTRHFGMFA